MYHQKIDLSKDVSFMKIVRVVCDCRPERQYILITPRKATYKVSASEINNLTMLYKSKYNLN